MIGFVVYDQSTRIVLRAGTCPLSQLSIQPKAGEAARCCAASIPLIQFTDGATLIDDITGIAWRSFDEESEQ